MRQEDIDDGFVGGVTSDGATEIRRLEQENCELNSSNEILRRIASFFGAERDRQHRLWWTSSSPTRTTLSKDANLFSSSSAGCYRWRQVLIITLGTGPHQPRTLRDAALSEELDPLWEENRKVYGVRKLWRAARRAGIDIRRDHTARLMRSLGIEAVKRSRRVKTSKPDPTAVRHPDLMKRVFW